MLDKFVPYGNTSFFWTRHYNKSIQYAGHCEKYDQFILNGDLNRGDWLGYYADGDDVCAIAG
jgi:hypothetical protein